jgi:hypothetical protein
MKLYYIHPPPTLSVLLFLLTDGSTYQPGGYKDVSNYHVKMVSFFWTYGVHLLSALYNNCMEETFDYNMKSVNACTFMALDLSTVHG